MRTTNGCFSKLFALALTAQVVFGFAATAVAQTTPVANGYGFRLITNNLAADVVPADGFDGFCVSNSFQRFSEIDLLLPDGEDFLLADQTDSFNSGHGGEPVFFQTTSPDGIPRGGHACGLNDATFYSFGSGDNPTATLWDLRFGDAPTFGNFRKLLEPGQPFSYVGGSATYLDGYTINANFSRTVMVGRFDLGFGPRTMVFEFFAGAQPRLLADLGNADQTISAALTSGTVYVKTINGDHTSIKLTAVPRIGSPFTVTQLDGVTHNDLSAPPYANEEMSVASNRTATVFSVRQGSHLVIQKLADGQTVPVTVLDTSQVETFPVSQVGSIAVADDGSIYLVMTTIVPGGDESIYRIDMQGTLTRVMTEGVDIRHARATGWRVFSGNNNRVLANRWTSTYEILPPK